jgi:hypothetical protein
LADSSNNPLSPLVKGWLNKIKLAEDLKKRDFGEDAEECMRFFNGPYTWMYKRKDKTRGDSSFDYDPDGEEDMPAPTFQMTVNKVAEVVQLFGPVLYQQNPDRRVQPRRTFVPPPEYFGMPGDPNAGMMYQQVLMQSKAAQGRDLARGMLFENLLNYTPTELDLRTESRLVIDEALIKGMGCWWTEVVELPDGRRLVGSFFDSADNVGFDPDAHRRSEAMWIYKKCCHPVWAVEREYNLPPGTLKGNIESASRQAETQGDADENYRRAQGASNDLIVYYKIWSKMGLGSRLKDVMTTFPGWRQEIDQLGDFVFLAVAENCDFPLNVPPALINSPDTMALSQAVEWPIPYYLDRGEWPVTTLVFHEVPNRLWPMAHMKPALGELKFINWVYSFLASKIRIASRDFLVLSKSLADDAKRAIKHGPDYTVIEVEKLHEDIDKVVKFLQHPTFNPEIYKVLDHMIEMFEKRTGLTDLIYGQTAQQLRSAEEARVKNANANVRPADMAKQVEDASSAIARKELAASRWALTDEDVKPILGDIGAALWKLEVMTSNPADIFHHFDCQIEGGSTARPDRDRDIANLNQAMQTLFQPLFQFAMTTGQVGPVNSLVGDWSKSVGLDADKYLIAPPPPPPAPAPGGPPAAGQQQGQAA